MIDAKLIPSLIELADKERLPVSQKAVWSIVNATRGGTDEQIQYLMDTGALKIYSKWLSQRGLLCGVPFDTLMAVMNATEKLLNFGKRQKKFHKYQVNQVAVEFKSLHGFTFLRKIQQNRKQIFSDEMVEKAGSIIMDHYYESDGEDVSNELAVKVPKNYKCMKCKSIGDHWIMQCNANW